MCAATPAACARSLHITQARTGEVFFLAPARLRLGDERQPRTEVCAQPGELEHEELAVREIRLRLGRPDAERRQRLRAARRRWS